jgi:hypothetical protein
MPRKPNARVKFTAPPEPQALPPAAGPASVTLTGERLRLFDDVRNRYSLDAATEAVLRNGCEAMERAAQYAEQVTRDGGTFKDRFGSIKVNPAAALERDYRALGDRCLRQLAAMLEG